MPILEWSDEITVNVKELDEQHKQLFSIINNLYDSMSQSKSQIEIREILQRLIDYTSYHFSKEEDLFTACQYEAKEAHKLLHEIYVKKVNQFKEQADREAGFLLSYELLDFLEDWWFQHINGEDKKYSKCLNGHGLY